MVRTGGFWRRFAAAIIDSIICNIAISFVGGILGVGMSLGGMANPDAMMRAGYAAMGGFYLLAIVGSWLYFALMESSALQATVGKLALGVIVTDLAGNRISFGRATGRYFAKILSGLILMIGYIMAAFTERNQALHDMIAGTLVYKTRNPAEVRSLDGVFE